MRRIIALLIGIIGLATGTASAQKTVVEGYVTDAANGEPLPFASLKFVGSSQGTRTDGNGYYLLSATADAGIKLEVSYLGYTTQVLTVKTGVRQRLDIRLSPDGIVLEEVEVKRKREHYRRRDNPAVLFVRQVIGHRESNDPRNHDYFSYEQYQKMVFALNEYKRQPRKGGKKGKFDFLSEFIDTLEVGTTILPVSEKERLETVFYRKAPKSEKRLVMADKSSGVDEIFSRDGIQQFLGEVFRETNIFQNNIPLFLQRFVSPLSTIGPTFYKYYLLDTVQVAGQPCVDLGFTPFNSESFGFTGHLFVSLDSTYFVRRAVLNVAKDINLNFVSGMTIEQTFERAPDSTRIQTKDDIRVNFKLSEKSKGMYAQRLIIYRNHSFEHSQAEQEKVFNQSAPILTDALAYNRPDVYWDKMRPEEARKKNPKSVEQLMSRLRSVPIFYYTEQFISIMVSGYIPTDKDARKNKFDLGPMNSTVNGNAIEGARFRVGGGTTPAFNEHWFLEGYAAYGTRDRKLKYDAIAEYSFTPRNTYRLEYPIHSLRFEYMYDINKLGQKYMYTSKDNVMLAIRRKKDTRATYLRLAEMTYTREHYNGFSYKAILRNRREYATPYALFNRIEADGTFTPRHHYDMTELEIDLRYGYNEKFYQTRTQRFPITFDAWVINLSHAMAKKGFLGSSYDYQRTEFGLQKRFWFSAFGYLDAIVKAGKVWNEVPYPLLILPNANLTYTIQPETYTNMNALEFINDEHVSWDLTYYLNGNLLNRLPLIKKLQWREVFCFRGLWGHLTDKNDPVKGIGKGLFAFPNDTYRLNRTPYMEASVGFENIFKFLRIDYVWRLNYRSNPHIQKSGIRCTMNIFF